MGNTGISETESLLVMTSPSLSAVSQGVTIKMKFPIQYNVQYSVFKIEQAYSHSGSSSSIKLALVVWRCVHKPVEFGDSIS